MLRTPYIGITGFTAEEQVRTTLNILPPNSNRLIMVGVLASSKTIRGQPNTWPKRYPIGKRLHEPFIDHPRVLNLLHFNTKRPEVLPGDMLWAQQLAGPHCHGFQLNIAWPRPQALEKYKEETAACCNTIVLQCGEKALNEVSNNPAELVRRLRHYEGLIEYVLIDPSGGAGKTFKMDSMLGYVRMLRRYAPNSIGIGIAGGFSTENVVERLPPFLREGPVSCDIESGVRDAQDDDLVVEACQEYVRLADQAYTVHGF